MRGNLRIFTRLEILLLKLLLTNVTCQAWKREKCHSFYSEIFRTHNPLVLYLMCWNWHVCCPLSLICFYRYRKLVLKPWRKYSVKICDSLKFIFSSINLSNFQKSSDKFTVFTYDQWVKNFKTFTKKYKLRIVCTLWFQHNKWI